MQQIFRTMPNISNRAQQMPASPVRKLVPFALQAKQRGTKVYHLNIGQPDIETPETALNALKNIDLKVLEYALSEGNIEYRKALTDYYHSLDFTDLTPDNFIVTNGGSEALNFAISTLRVADAEGVGKIKSEKTHGLFRFRCMYCSQPADFSRIIRESAPSPMVWTDRDGSTRFHKCPACGSSR